MNRTDNGNDQCGDYSNEVYMHLADAYSNEKRTRLKGYYCCPADGEFIRAAGRVKGKCPYCGRECDRMITVNNVLEQTIYAIWKDSGIYSDLRTDKKFTRKENGAA